MILNFLPWESRGRMGVGGVAFYFFVTVVTVYY